MRIRSGALLVLAASCLAARASHGEDPLDARIRAATGRATKALAAAFTAPPPGPLPRAVTFAPPGRETRPLVALALLRAGGADERKLARKLLDDWYGEAVGLNMGGSNYELALAVSAHEGLAVERVEAAAGTVTRYEAKPIEPEVSDRLELLARTLVAGRHPTFDDKGCAWSYDRAPWQTGATTSDRPARSGFDNSNTQFAVLALHDAARGGVVVPPSVAAAIAEHFLAAVCDPPRGSDVGWGYGMPACGSATPRMTFAGISSLAIARELGAKDARIDRTIDAALATLGARIAEIEPPSRSSGGGMGTAYALYSLEKALDVLDVKEVDHKDWFGPLAESVLSVQDGSGLWGSDPVDTALYVLFLTRATISRARLVDSRATGGGANAHVSEVYLPRTKKTVDARGLVLAYANGDATRAAAAEALRALEEEGHGRDACLLGVLALLDRRGGDRRDAARTWGRELCGKTLSVAELEGWEGTWQRLREGDTARLRAALAATHPLPLRAFAASELARLACADAAPDVIAAADGLAGETLLEKGAGARCARAFADALTALTASNLPALPARGPVAASDLRAVARAAREKLLHALDEEIDRALSAQQKKDASWPELRKRVATRSALLRMVDRGLFALLRAVTGELIPDEPEVWRRFIS